MIGGLLFCTFQILDFIRNITDSSAVGFVEQHEVEEEARDISLLIRSQPHALLTKCNSKITMHSGRLHQQKVLPLKSVLIITDHFCQKVFGSVDRLCAFTIHYVLYIT